MQPTAADTTPASASGKPVGAGALGSQSNYRDLDQFRRLIAGRRGRGYPRRVKTLAMVAEADGREFFVYANRTLTTFWIGGREGMWTLGYFHTTSRKIAAEAIALLGGSAFTLEAAS